MANSSYGWFYRAKEWFRQGPYDLTRRPVPEAGSENLIFLTWALPEQSPIASAIPNHRQFMFQEPINISDHLVGLIGPGGYEVTYPYQSTPLTQTETDANGPQIVFYG